MNVTCEQCGAQYVVADQKIQGADRVYNVRCKGCSAIMAIRGIESATAETPEPDWYYAHDSEQAGPVDEDGLREAMSQGALSESTLVWRTGMSDWTAASDVPALVGLFAAPAEDLTADVASEDADADNNETQMVEMPEEFDKSQTPEHEAIAEF